jgi:CelD/BcsL family acetyltransferase involved in cellulose biosynthesis
MGNVSAAADPVVVASTAQRYNGSWVPGVEELPFCLGGRNLKTIRLKALTLDVPFTRLSTNLEEAAPMRDAFPAGIEAAVVPAQPIATDPPRLTILPDIVRYTTAATNRYFVDLRSTFPEYMKKFSAKPRYNLSRTVRKFAEFSGGALNCRQFLSREMEDFHAFADEISRHSWKEEVGGPGFAGTVRKAEILSLADEGSARGFVLFYGERPIAYVFCIAHDEHLIYKHVGYHQAFAKWSPGTVLLYLILERLFAEQEYEFLDLGEGTLWYKSFFSTHYIRCARVIYFRRSLRNLVIISAHAGLTTGSVVAGKVFRALKLKQAIKRVMMGKLYRPGQ